MRCDIEQSVSVTLTLDVGTFQLIQTALAFYVERGNLPPGAPVRDLMWKFAGMLSKLNTPKESVPALPAPSPAPSVAPLARPPEPVGSPTPPLTETVSMAVLEAPEEDEFEDPTLPEDEVDREESQ